MVQMELFEGLVPLQQYLHVWSEAERARAIKKPGCEARAKDRSDPVREDGERDWRIRQPVSGRSCADTPNPHQGEGLRK
jgi:hypothetical protein